MVWVVSTPLADAIVAVVGSPFDLEAVMARYAGIVEERDWHMLYVKTIAEIARRIAEIERLRNENCEYRKEIERLVGVVQNQAKEILALREGK